MLRGWRQSLSPSPLISHLTGHSLPDPHRHRLWPHAVLPRAPQGPRHNWGPWEPCWTRSRLQETLPAGLLRVSVTWDTDMAEPGQRVGQREIGEGPKPPKATHPEPSEPSQAEPP